LTRGIGDYAAVILAFFERAKTFLIEKRGKLLLSTLKEGVSEA